MLMLLSYNTIEYHRLQYIIDYIFYFHIDTYVTIDPNDYYD